jgi:hypothetical protein
MINCLFRLNGQGMSTLVCPGVGFFPAYSGYEGVHRNNPDSMAIPDEGPLPTGKYYIVNRPVGGPRSKFIDAVKSMTSGSDRDIWFGLFRDDASIDDQTFIDGVERGLFRLHPAGRTGVSEGCITLPSHAHYAILRNALMQTGKHRITPTLLAYGTVQVY